ncbi:MAG: hypothetical protein LBR64_01045 [Dysgonamonadaceae bacterium]|jgi:hypothetical protein|nr:hypothetical protein [Dysgonamonadaceae bacterium]
MTGSRLYMLILGAVVVLLFLFQLTAPHRFSWKPTFYKNDREPFGCYVFDDVMSSSLPDYQVINKTFYQIYAEDSLTSNRAFLVVEDNLQFEEIDADYMFKLVETGCRIMICAQRFPYSLTDSLKFSYDQDYFYRYKSGNKMRRDSIFTGVDTIAPERIFSVFEDTHSTYLQPFKQEYVKNDEDEEYSYKNIPILSNSLTYLAWNSENRPLALRLSLGKGELIICSTPLLFTNYGMLDKDNAAYAFRLLSAMKGRPLSRIEAYGKYFEESRSPLRYALSEPPLHWAIYSALILIILFMVFTARRRQRVIPVVNPPVNRSFGFMQLIGNLYYGQHDNVEIIRLKLKYFAAEMKSQTGIEFENDIPQESGYKRIADKTGLEIEEVQTLFENLKSSLSEYYINDRELKKYIDGLTKILKAMKI